mmetsp:Transcript_18881/g.26529  ORF Transcript_18881/g.26529 Transcript_18881/m.26529 type:complete len:90 (+) Transcript_18881:95-364(+)
MESRSYNFSVGKKRSTQLSSKIIFFPKWDDNAPRVLILKKECPDQYSTFSSCMKANDNDENICYEKKQALLECGGPAFRKANSDETYTY